MSAAGHVRYESLRFLASDIPASKNVNGRDSARP